MTSFRNLTGVVALSAALLFGQSLRAENPLVYRQWLTQYECGDQNKNWGNLPAAKACYLKALTIADENIGPHSGTAITTIAALADLFRSYANAGGPPELREEALLWNVARLERLRKVDDTCAYEQRAGISVCHDESLGAALVFQADILGDRGDYEAGRPFYDEAFAIMQQTEKSVSGKAKASLGYAEFLRAGGWLEEAEAHYHVCLQAFDEIADFRFRIDTLNGYAGLLSQTDRIDEAIAAYERAYAVFQDERDPYQGGQFNLTPYLKLLRWQGRGDEADRILNKIGK